MAANKLPIKPATTADIDQFLTAMNQSPAPTPSGKGRLVFAMDATASRQPTWDHACRLQGDMFTRTKGLGGLSVQLCFYRGYDEFRVSPWHSEAHRLLQAMLTVQCQGGHTQIKRVLTHTLNEHRLNSVQAVVFVGDCIEENIDDLCQLAGEHGLKGVPIFIFQEGNDMAALRGFKQIARLSRGAHCHFDAASPELLAELLGAVAVYASGGAKALEKMAQTSPQIRQLTRQLENPEF